MIIELFGLPGSGKTTFAKYFVSKSGANPVVIRTLSERIRYFVIFLIKYPIRTAFLLWIFISNMRYGLIRYKAHLLTVSMATVVKSLELKGKFNLVDEGLLQRVLSLYEREIDVKQALRILTHINFVNVIVCSTGGNFSRFAIADDKVNSPRYKMGKKYYTNWTNVVKRNTEILVSEIRKFPAGSFLEGDLIDERESVCDKLILIDLKLDKSLRSV